MLLAEMSDDDIRDCMHQDHEQVLALARAALESPRSERTVELFAQLSDHIERHCRAERAVLYPAVSFLNMPAAQAAPADCLHAFDTCQRLVQALSAPGTIPKTKWRSMAQRLLDLLTVHVRDQHRHLVPLLSHRVSAGLRRELGGHYRRVSAEAAPPAAQLYSRPLP